IFSCSLFSSYNFWGVLQTSGKFPWAPPYYEDSIVDITTIFKIKIKLELKSKYNNPGIIDSLVKKIPRGSPRYGDSTVSRIIIYKIELDKI
ncbi:hypothetical protein, partial [uncultured Anaerococcus sp.]|uniref:hypothetical protein n=1 Tax=uncultured Anaerococcus sp. TaxID=293428 RepID=UPI0025EB0ACD